MELLSIAWRNIFRNRRRSILNLISLVVGIVILILAVGWIRGYFTTLYGGIMRFDTGHAQVLRPEYLEKERKLPLDLGIKEYQKVQRNLLELPFVKEATGRIDLNLRVGNGTDSIPVMGRAVEPEREGRVTVIDEHIEAGSWLKPSDDGGLVGSGIAGKLKLAVGDTLWIRGQDRYNAPNLIALPIRGIFSLGFPMMDQGMVYLSMEQADSFLRMEGSLTRIVLQFQEGVSPEEGVKELASTLPESLSAWSWRRFAQSLVKAVEADSGSFYILMAVLSLLIFLNILNSMSMTVRERGGELGTLRAIGMRKGEIRKMLYLESLLLSLLAAAFGLLIASGFAWYMQEVGFDFSSALPEDLPVPFGERFRADFRWWDFGVGILFSSATALLGTLIPAARASRLSVAQTMRMKGV